MATQKRTFWVLAKFKDGGQKSGFFDCLDKAQRERERFESQGAVACAIARLRGANAQPTR